jgi:hypothetical protein
MEACPHCTAKARYYRDLLATIHGDREYHRFLRSRITEAMNWWTKRSVLHRPAA